MGENKAIIFIGALKNKTLDKSTGGVFTACTTLLQGLQKEGKQVIGLNTTYKMTSIRSGINPLRKLAVLITRNIYFLLKISRHTTASSVLVFISAGNSYLDKLPSVLVAKLLRKKIIIFPRSGFLLRDYEKSFFRFFINLVFSNADIVICQSEFWKNYFLEKGVSCTKLIVIENWYPTEQIEASEKISFKKQLITGELRIVFLSRIEKAKGVDDLVLASELLANQGIKHTVSIYGEGEYVSELLDHIEERKLDHIKFKGWLSDKNKLTVLNDYDLAVFTSRFEGYPNVLLDFIFGKIPVIAANIDSVRAVGGKFMSYYSPDAPSELAEAILKVGSDYVKYSEKAEALYFEKLKKNNITTATKSVLEAIEPSKDVSISQIE